MAIIPRTIKEIEDAMILDKESRPELNGLNSTSQVAIWRNLIFSFAVASSLNEISQEEFQKQVEERALEIPTGTERWYASESLNFQDGDALEFIDGNVVYPIIDESKRIIILAAADKENGFLVIKVAKLDVAGNAIAITPTELTSFKEYWSQKKFACTPLAFVSQESDKAIIDYRIGVNATVINPVTGESLTTPGIFPVKDAINEFLKTFQAENFSSIFRIMKLTDAIQSVAGVENAVAQSVQIKPFDGVYTEVITEINEEHLTQAGYITVSTTGGETLDDTLTYY
ncbi:MAG: hypothetical protein QQN55_08505 [Nitrosopumilus sp.]